MQLKTLRSTVVAAVATAIMVFTLTFAAGSVAASSGKHFYRVTKLVGDVKGEAQITDPNLVNAWGLSHSPTSPWWISDNGPGLSTLYSGTGSIIPLVVTIPAAASGQSGTPSGQVFNGTGQFMVSNGTESASASFIFDSEDGVISGWSSTTGKAAAIPAVVQPNSVFKGLALGAAHGANYLYATDFHNAKIDVFDSNFKRVTLSRKFVDHSIPKHFAPFGIANINNKLYVTYAHQDADRHDDASGKGRGFLDVFNTNGKLLKRLISRGALNSPWGVAVAPKGFGKASGDLLVGNFGDGRINAYNLNNGHFAGSLNRKNGQPIAIPGLWGIEFGNGASAGPTTSLYFTAGPGGESHGLFGTVTHQ